MMFITGPTDFEICAGWRNAETFVSQGSHTAGMVVFTDVGGFGLCKQSVVQVCCNSHHCGIIDIV